MMQSTLLKPADRLRSPRSHRKQPNGYQAKVLKATEASHAADSALSAALLEGLKLGGAPPTSPLSRDMWETVKVRARTAESLWGDVCLWLCEVQGDLSTKARADSEQQTYAHMALSAAEKVIARTPAGLVSPEFQRDIEERFADWDKAMISASARQKHAEEVASFGKRAKDPESARAFRQLAAELTVEALAKRQRVAIAATASADTWSMEADLLEDAFAKTDEASPPNWEESVELRRNATHRARDLAGRALADELFGEESRL